MIIANFNFILKMSHIVHIWGNLVYLCLTFIMWTVFRKLSSVFCSSRCNSPKLQVCGGRCGKVPKTSRMGGRVFSRGRRVQKEQKLLNTSASQNKCVINNFSYKSIFCYLETLCLSPESTYAWL